MYSTAFSFTLVSAKRKPGVEAELEQSLNYRMKGQTPKDLGQAADEDETPCWENAGTRWSGCLE